MDATIIEAPSSTKNRAGDRDPEMHQTKKGNEYYFGTKPHIGVDSDSGLVHSMTTTLANVHDVTEATGCCMVGSLSCGVMLGTWESGTGRRTGS